MPAKRVRSSGADSAGDRLGRYHDKRSFGRTPEPALLAVAQHCQQETERQITWLTTRMKVAAPQALLVAE
jgi:hypothetical protein